MTRANAGQVALGVAFAASVLAAWPRASAAQCPVPDIVSALAAERGVEWGVDCSRDPRGNACDHATAVEVSTATDGADRVGAAYMLGKCPGGGATEIGWTVSDEDGANPVSGSLSPGDPDVVCIPGVTVVSASDPVLVWSVRNAVWLLSWVALFNVADLDPAPPELVLMQTAGIVISRISAKGAYLGSALVVDDRETTVDKEWLECDNRPGYSVALGKDVPAGTLCYLGWSQRQGTPRDRMVFKTSSDGGLTWSAQRETDVAGIGIQIVITSVRGRSGRIVVPYLVKGRSPEFFTLGFLFSADQGMTWEQGATFPGSAALSPGLSDGDDPSPDFLRAHHIPSAVGDGYGRVYVFWEDCRARDEEGRRCHPTYHRDRNRSSANDIVFVKTTDGVYIDDVQVVPLPGAGEPGSVRKSYFLPGASVVRDWTDVAPPCPRLALSYYAVENNIDDTGPALARCSPQTCRLVPYLVQSGDGGASWSDPHPLSREMYLDWLPLTGYLDASGTVARSAGRMLGDYFSTSITFRSVHTAMSEARAPAPAPAAPALYDQSIVHRSFAR